MFKLFRDYTSQTLDGLMLSLELVKDNELPQLLGTFDQNGDFIQSDSPNCPLFDTNTCAAVCYTSKEIVNQGFMHVYTDAAIPDDWTEEEREKDTQLLTEFVHSQS